MTNELDTLAAALYVKTDDVLKASPYLARWRPAVGIMPKLRAPVGRSGMHLRQRRQVGR